MTASNLPLLLLLLLLLMVEVVIVLANVNTHLSRLIMSFFIGYAAATTTSACHPD
jgi:hypothetical protein